MTVQLHTYCEPPAVLKQLAFDLTSNMPTVDTVMFMDSVIDKDGEPHKGLGYYYPNQKLIEIHLHNCSQDMTFVNKGFYIIPNFFLNVLNTIYHEVCHAEQILEHPELTHKREVPNALEQEAIRVAMDHTYRWLQYNNIPPVTQFGTKGDNIIDAIIQSRDANEPAAFEDITTYKLGMHASINRMLGVGALDQVAWENLCDLVDSGQVGRNIDNIRYLTALEALGYHLNRHQFGNIIQPFDKEGEPTMNVIPIYEYVAGLLFSQYDVVATLAAHYNGVITNVQTRLFKQGAVRAIDMTVGGHNIRMIEQNKSTMSQYAQLAQQGHQIAWVVDRDIADTWYGRVEDGKWVASTPRAQTRVGEQTSAAPDRQAGGDLRPPDLGGLTEVEPPDIPDFIVAAMFES